jgi:murein DD-endopeptidase MepM/ murein hydrolase activator NlpD
MRKALVLFFFLTPLVTTAGDKQIKAVLLHPVFDRYYACAEHSHGQFKSLGDALGTDCFIVNFVESDGRKWIRPYNLDGHKNEDWYGWKQNVLAPVDGKIVKTYLNDKVNLPGTSGSGLASFIEVLRNDGVHVLLAHVMEISVKVGDRVKAGQSIAKVGNNGQAWQPHIHIGAWKEKEPLQIRFDQMKIRGEF